MAPHHAYEAAQAEAATGVRPFARAWLHVGLVGLDGQMMAKATGNLVFVSDRLAQVPGPVVRTMLLDRRRDHPGDDTPALLEKAGAKLDALHAASQPHHSGTATRAVLDALCHMLDVPGALDIATVEGGQTARDAIAVLGLQSGLVALKVA